jgi:2-polyprenyl-3-methyl-5-hydroxy-6-metoxy-1,4-benzoquinol methylase
MSVRASAPVVAGNVYDKYGTTNPVARRLMVGFERGMNGLLDMAGAPDSVLEVGCGEGHVTAKLAGRWPRARVVGSDLSSEIIAEARTLHPALDFEVRSVYDVAEDAGRFDLVVACEVFEHLDDPVRALDALARVSQRHVFVSVPREPVWRALNLARGRYVRNLGNTPGHLQHWSTRAFLALLETRLDVVAVRTPLPWTQALCRYRP